MRTDLLDAAVVPSSTEVVVHNKNVSSAPYNSIGIYKRCVWLLNDASTIVVYRWRARKNAKLDNDVVLLVCLTRCKHLSSTKNASISAHRLKRGKNCAGKGNNTSRTFQILGPLPLSCHVTVKQWSYKLVIVYNTRAASFIFVASYIVVVVRRRGGGDGLLRISPKSLVDTLRQGGLRRPEVWSLSLLSTNIHDAHA